MRREGREGEAGFGNRSGFPHLTPALSAPGAERGTAEVAWVARHHYASLDQLDGILRLLRPG